MMRIISGGGRLLGFIVLQGIAFPVLAGLTMAGSDLAAQQAATAAEGAPDPAAALGQLGVLVGMVGAQAVAMWLLMRRVPGAFLNRAVIAFAAAFITGTVLSQIDSFVFLADFRGGLGIRIVAMGLVTSLSAAILATLLFPYRDKAQAGPPLPATAPAWATALVIAALFHIVIYFVFGYYVIWVHEIARDYYAGGDLVPLWQHMQNVAGGSPWLFLVQFVRGLIWAGIAALVFLTAKGGRAALTAVTLALYLAFGVAPLLVPNALMPLDIRQLHMIELTLTAVAMAAAAWVLFRGRAS